MCIIKPDSTFLKYRYKILDGWLGYNFGIHKPTTDRHRIFLAMRYFDGFYIDQPDQLNYLETRRYNNIFGYLSELTFFKQDFYKTRYVFGFGRTEDIPYGYSFGIIAGYIRQLKIERPYAALKWSYDFAEKKGNFIRLQAQGGAYLREQKMEDIILQGGASYFTRLFQVNRYKSRSLFAVTYTHLTNRRVIDYLNISRKEIPGFGTDSLNANQRLALHAESVLFIPGSLLGFRFAPFAAVDMVSVNCVQCITSNELYWGFSGGLRTRNENLIFGTIEMKFTYIPEDQYGNSKFVFGLKQNLKIKNTGSFVKAPALLFYN